MQTIDRGHNINRFIICWQCKHFNSDEARCKAFLDEIPDDILFGKVDHDKPYPGDNGIQFEAKEE